MDELVFEITQEADGGFTAECLTEGIFTEGDNWEELRSNVREAVAAFYFDRPHPPPAIRLDLVRRGALVCEGGNLGCDFTLFTVESVHSIE